MKTTLETSGEDENYTRNEWGRCKDTLDSKPGRARSDSLPKLQMQTILNYTRFERRTSETTLVSSGEQVKLHSFRVENK